MSLVMPVLLGGPICYFFARKLRELAVAHETLAIIASQDSLTTCLNRGAFVTLTDAYLSRVDSEPACYGAMLVVDADHFKRVNDRFGHANGDIALKLIAQSMKSALRSVDLLGRVGGEEFAVFLPKMDRTQLENVAQRIRQAVTNLDFRPNGTPEELSVSVGAVTFQGMVTYDQLFQAADQKLFEAKHLGRNRVEYGVIAGGQSWARPTAGFRSGLAS